MKKYPLLAKLSICCLLSCNGQSSKDFSSCYIDENCYFINNGNSTLLSDNFSCKQFFLELENCNFDKAYSLLIKRGFRKTSFAGGYFVLVPEEGKASAIDYFLSYRFAESQNDVEINKLRHILLDSYNLLKDSSYGSKCLKLAIEKEKDFLELYDEESGQINLERLNKIKNWEQKSEQPPRYKYLLAVANFNSGLYSESFPLFYSLLANKKYL